jgi:3-phenylpropionate/trans-cinnamate dioxygenase ferredoxin reductase subunit
LRAEGATGSIALIGRELDAPYHRPPISKGYLTGRESRSDALVLPDGWWEENDVELMTRSSVTAIDVAAKTATLQSKEEIGFGQALVATGAMVRRLDVEGADLEGIHYLRALGNADSLRRDLAGAERIVCVGGSYIACEVAASLTELGHSCTLVMQEEVTLERGFGQRAGRRVQSVLEDHGVKVIAADEVERFTGADEKLTGVVTQGGRELPADVVVAGVGAIPDVMLARRSQLELGPLGGVATDARLESSAPGVFAAGDICEYDSVVHGRPMRIEHEEVAAAQGATVARSMLGSREPHREVPYFFSDLSEWASLEYVGPALEWDQEVVRGDEGSGTFSVWYLGDGRVRALLSFGRSEDLDDARRLIASGASVAEHREALGDPAANLSAI